MPTQKKQSTMFRQWAILHCLSAHNQETQVIHARLAQEHDIAVHENTVLRDLKALEFAGLPLERTESKPINWKIKKDWQDKLGGMTDAEALMIVMAGQYVKQALPITLTQPLNVLFELAQKNLNAKKQHKTAQWLNKISVIPAQQTQIAPAINITVQTVITQSLLDNQPISAIYKGYLFKKLSPLALVIRGNVLYLAATQDDDDLVKHFVLHRFESAVLLYGEELNKPKDFSLEVLLQQGWGDFVAADHEAITLQCWCNGALKDHLSEMRLHETQWIDYKNSVNGRYKLSVTLPYTGQLYMWLMSQGAKLEVMQPVWLRQKIQQEVQAMLACYQ